MADPAAVVPLILGDRNELPPPPAEYKLVLGKTIVDDGELLTTVTTIQQILHWIGFHIVESRENLCNNLLGSFEEIQLLTKKYVQSIATDWVGQTAALGQFYMGNRRLKYLQALTHWAQELRQVSQAPTIVGLNEFTFKAHLLHALDRSVIKKTLTKQNCTASSTASPGPLDSEQKWKQWEEKFINYLTLYLGSYGVPLLYVICENDDPDYHGEYIHFISKTIACAPLTGEFYATDRMTVFNMIVSFGLSQPYISVMDGDQ